MSRTFCAECGNEMDTSPGLVVSICLRCQGASRQIGERAFTLRKKGGRVEGPFPGSVLTEWIAKGVLESTDEISSAELGAWTTVEQHQAFRAWFTPGDPLFKNRLEAISSRSRRFALDAARHRLRNLVLIALCAGFIGLPFVTLRARALVLPESWVLASSSALQKLWSVASTKLKHASNKVDAPVMTESELPGQAILARLDSLPKSFEPASLLYMRGKALSYDVRSAARAEARTTLESAFRASPRDPAIIAALALEYQRASGLEPSLAQDAADLLSRADTLSPNHPVVAGARCQIQLSPVNPEPSLLAADTCLARDPENLDCQYCKGLALSKKSESEKAFATVESVLRRAPHLPAFQIGVGRLALESGSYAQARSTLEAFVRSYPLSAEGHALMSRLAFLTADWDRALLEAKRTIELDEDSLDERLLAAQLSLSLSGPDTAHSIISKILSHPRLKAWDKGRDAWLVESQSLRGMGRHRDAIEAARKSLELSEDWAPALLAQAQARQAAGDSTGVENIVKSTANSDLPPLEAARYHIGIGQIYLGIEREKAAIAFFESALEADPAAVEARLGLAAVYVKMGSIDKAVSSLKALTELDFEQVDTHPPYHLCIIGRTPVDSLRTGFEAAIKKNIKYSPELPVFQGILAYLRGDLGRAEARFKDALRANEGDDDARAWLGRVYMERQQDSEALAIWQRLAATRGNVGMYSVFHGTVLARVGKHQESTRAFEQALQSTRDWPGVYRRRAQSLLLAGDPAGAQASLREVLRLDPLDHQARKLMLKCDEPKKARLP